MFAGLFTYPKGKPPRQWVDEKAWKKALFPYHKPDLSGSWSDQQSMIVESDILNTPWSHHTKAVPLVIGKHVVAFWGRLDNREELAGQLELGARLSESTDTVLVRAAWQRWGEELPKYLLGDFTLAIIDTDKRQLFIARDPLGVKPLYYWPHAKGFMFASTPAAFRALKKISPTPDMDWAARYIINLSSSHDQTGYEEIKKLPGGCSILVSAKGEVNIQRYHQWRDDAPNVFKRDPARLDEYRHELELAIRRHMPSDYPLGTENSGGIDSATITAYLAKFIGIPGDKLYSLGFAIAEEEPAFILETSQVSQIKHNYIVTSRTSDSDDSSEQILRNLAILGYPEEHGNGSAHGPFYDECKRHGIRTLFSGYGGDEVVTNYAYNVRLELLDQGQYGAFMDMMRGNPLFQFLRTLKRIPPDRKQLEYNPKFLATWKRRWPHQILRSDAVERLGLHHTFMQTARYDAPYRRLNDWIINGLLPMGYIPTRLENCTLVAISHGIDYRWPLWDARLVQRYLSTPIVERFGPKGVNRYLHRRAITGTVPDRVAWKPSKDMGYGPAMLSRGDDNKQLINQMKRSEKNLHPALDELVDRAKWRSQIKGIESGPKNELRDMMLRRQSQSINWLNHWLHDGPVE